MGAFQPNGQSVAAFFSRHPTVSPALASCSAWLADEDPPSWRVFGPAFSGAPHVAGSRHRPAASAGIGLPGRPARVGRPWGVPIQRGRSEVFRTRPRWHATGCSCGVIDVPTRIGLGGRSAFEAQTFCLGWVSLTHATADPNRCHLGCSRCAPRNQAASNPGR